MPLRPEIVRGIRRAPREAVDTLVKAGVATTHEAYGRTGLMYGIRPVVGGLSAGGTAITCLNFAGDNLMIFAALQEAQPGDVIVVGVTAPSEHGMVGEMLAMSCRERGVAAVVLDAGARDVGPLRDRRFPVWSRHISAAGTVKNSLGWVNVPITCGGQVVFPGDAIVADDDGVVVVGRDDTAEVADLAARRAEREAGSLAAKEANLRAAAAGQGTPPAGASRFTDMFAPIIREGRDS